MFVLCRNHKVCNKMKNCGKHIDISNMKKDENIKENATLYVPNGTYQTYAGANCWRDFLKIKEFDSTGVESVFSTSDVKDLSRYTVNGQRLN